MIVACEQALWGTLTAGREKEGELGTTSLEFEYVHRKSQCEMLIVGDDISNNVITPNWHLFFNVCLHSRSFLLCVDWWKSDSSVDGEPQENWGWNLSYKLSFLFLPCHQCSWRACSQAIVIVSRGTGSKFEGNLSKLENYNTL